MRTPAIFDGEICALDEHGVSQFDWMIHGDKRKTFLAFDVLRLRSRWIVDEPLWKREDRLRNVIVSENGSLLRLGMVTDGVGLYAQASALNLEGVVGKDRNSRYIAGERSAAWVKVKTPFGARVVAERMRNAARARVQTR